MSSDDRPDLLAFGETMLVLRSESPGPLQHNDLLRLSCAGAESTVAIGLARLCHRAMWAGRVGDDEPGAVVRESLRGAGVEVCATIDAGRPTGLLVRTARTPELSRVYYYRQDSAGAGLTIDDLKEALSRRPRLVHATGITPALSAQARLATVEALTLAHDLGALVSFDVNHRSRLTSIAYAARMIADLLPFVDIVFCGEDELPVLAAALGTDPTIDAVLAAQRAEIVIKRGRNGAIAQVGDYRATTLAIAIPAVDVVGAGDAFVAGYLSGLLDRLPLEERLHRAALLGAFCVATHGDWEGLPNRSELGLLEAAPDFTDR